MRPRTRSTTSATMKRLAMATWLLLTATTISSVEAELMYALRVRKRPANAGEERNEAAAGILVSSERRQRDLKVGGGYRGDYDEDPSYDYVEGCDPRTGGKYYLSYRGKPGMSEYQAGAGRPWNGGHLRRRRENFCICGEGYGPCPDDMPPYPDNDVIITEPPVQYTKPSYDDPGEDEPDYPDPCDYGRGDGRDCGAGSDGPDYPDRPRPCGYNGRDCGGGDGPDYPDRPRPCGYNGGDCGDPGDRTGGGGGDLDDSGDGPSGSNWSQDYFRPPGTGDDPSPSNSAEDYRFEPSPGNSGEDVIGDRTDGGGGGIYVITTNVTLGHEDTRSNDDPSGSNDSIPPAQSPPP